MYRAADPGHHTFQMPSLGFVSNPIKELGLAEFLDHGVRRALEGGFDLVFKAVIVRSVVAAFPDNVVLDPIEPHDS